MNINIDSEMTKYKIGYLDESEQNRATFYRVFKNDFTVIFFEDNSKIKTLEELLSQIDELGLDALAVDYKLADSGWVRYNGDEVINKIWDCKRYFPVFLLTSYTGEAIQKTENAFLVNEKDVLNNEKAYKLLIDKVKGAIKSYGKIVSKIQSRAKVLEQKQRDNSISEKDEHELINLHIEMSHIDPEANPLSADMLQTQNVKDIHEMVDLTRQLLNSINQK